jgi:hypothetical protein
MRLAAASLKYGGCLFVFVGINVMPLKNMTNFETHRSSHFAKMPLLDITNLPMKTASAVIATTSDKENIIPSPTQQTTNLSNDNNLADYLKGICWDDDVFEETWQLDVTATSVDSQVPVQQWCEDDALLYWFEEFDKLRKDKSVVEAFQYIQQSETIHPLLRGFVNNDDEWEYFIDILKMIHWADGKYKFLPVYMGKCAVSDADGGYDLSC